MKAVKSRLFKNIWKEENRQYKGLEKACERHQDLFVEKKKKSNNMVANDINVFMSWKTKASWV